MYKMVFMNGKQVRVRREQEPSVDPMTMDDITLHQLGMWDVIGAKQESKKNEGTNLKTICEFWLNLKSGYAAGIDL